MVAAACGPRLLLIVYVIATTAFAASSRSRSQSKATPLKQDDFVIALASSTSRLALAQGTRAYRTGIRTLIMIDNKTMVPHLNKVYAKYREVYEYFPDETETDARKWHAKNPGDFRAATAPFAAHRYFGNTYKWMLYGDDDTLFFMPGVHKLLSQFSHKVPLALTDNLWYESTHPRLESFRCLPCGFNDSRLPEAQNQTGYKPRAACPYCKPADACPPTHPNCTITGAHGGAGVIFSNALLRNLPYEAALECMNQVFLCSGGDCLLSQCLWRAGYGFTDPGHSLLYDNPYAHVLFDNLHNRILMRQPIEQVVMGNCDAECRELLRSAVSFHLRGKSFPTFVKAALGMYALVESHAAALEFLDLLEDRASRAQPPAPKEGEL